MAQGPSDTILVAIRIMLRIWESKVRNPDPPDRRRFVLSEHRFLVIRAIHPCFRFYLCKKRTFWYVLFSVRTFRTADIWVVNRYVERGELRTCDTVHRGEATVGGVERCDM